MKIVSGASQNHARSLFQLVESVQCFEPDCQLVVYDLGLSLDNLERIRGLVGVENVKRFDYGAYPAFFDIAKNAGQYAWKPQIVWAELQLGDPEVCWMDAGNRVVRKLKRIRRSLKHVGFYSERSAGTIGDWTHPGMLRYLNLPENWGGNLKNLNGACVAFNRDIGNARTLAEEWARLARIESCIAPPGSDRSNHRQDQALLTVLAYKQNIIGKPTARPKFKFLKEFLIHQDIDS